jgi:hypothetical protein
MRVWNSFATLEAHMCEIALESPLSRSVIHLAQVRDESRPRGCKSAYFANELYRCLYFETASRVNNLRLLRLRQNMLGLISVKLCLKRRNLSLR